MLTRKRRNHSDLSEALEMEATVHFEPNISKCRYRHSSSSQIQSKLQFSHQLEKYE